MPIFECPVRNSPVNEQSITNRLIETADQCVKCGLCMPSCPTYRERQDEAESPRGRIALIQGWAMGHLEGSGRLEEHLSSCLECRACETVCPSLVRVGELMDGARALAMRRAPWRRRFLTRVWLGAMSGGLGIRIATLMATAYRRGGGARLARLTGLTKRPWFGAYHRLALQMKRPPMPAPAASISGTRVPELGLFLGCTGWATQSGAVIAAQRVFQHLDLRAAIPDGQGCCGAMHRHNGLPEEADELLERNAAALRDRVPVGMASACVAELRTHRSLHQTQEICRFLADMEWPPRVTLKPLDSRVSVHEPCSQRNILRDAGAAYDLLGRIPGIELLPLKDNSFCCGAAGTYMLQQPEMSQGLLRSKIADLATLGVDTLVTTNPGCAMHLSAGIQEAGLTVRVLHPVELIASQISSTPANPA